MTEGVLQVVQAVRGGATSVRRIPWPTPAPHELLVDVRASVISAGTERYVIELANKSLLGKARERPDQVRRVVEKVKREGLGEAMRQVRGKLDEELPLGNSAAGVVLATGSAVRGFRPGDRVAISGPHAEVVAVSEGLAAQIPEGVTFTQAAYAALGAIALEGVRRALTSLGDRVVVLGLGLVGQLTVGLLRAHGCAVFGVDPDASRCARAAAWGASATARDATLEAIADFTRGLGADAVVITATSDSNQPLELAAEVSRTRGRIVLVGVVGLKVPRRLFYDKELEFTVSCSLGPGRYDERPRDYPPGYVRWTAQRNLVAVLDTIAAGRLPVDDLTSHRFPIATAPEAYELIRATDQPLLGVQLEYGPAEAPAVRVTGPGNSRPSAGSRLGVSVIGVGNFARLVQLPLLATLGVERRGIVSAHGLNATVGSERHGFAFAASDAAEVLNDAQTDAVLVLTRHDLHADLILRALGAGKHVFVEKPLCLSLEELSAIKAAVEAAPQGPIVTVGFNRRWSAGVTELRRVRTAIPGSVSVGYRFVTASPPATSWTRDLAVGGGRLIGEACHALDACTAVTGSPPVRVYADASGGADDRAAITLRHRDGSVSRITYEAEGDARGPKERIEVFGGGQTAILDDGARMELWRGGRKTTRKLDKGKGHPEQLSRFVGACRAGTWPIPWAELHAVAWATLAAAESLRTGLPVEGPA